VYPPITLFAAIRLGKATAKSRAWRSRCREACPISFRGDGRGSAGVLSNAPSGLCRRRGIWPSRTLCDRNSGGSCRTCRHIGYSASRQHTRASDFRLQRLLFTVRRAVVTSVLFIPCTVVVGDYGKRLGAVTAGYRAAAV
jgi:hypothetical protein